MHDGKCWKSSIKAKKIWCTFLLKEILRYRKLEACYFSQLGLFVRCFFFCVISLCLSLFVRRWNFSNSKGFTNWSSRQLVILSQQMHFSFRSYSTPESCLSSVPHSVQGWLCTVLDHSKTPHRAQGIGGSWCTHCLKKPLGLQMPLSWEALAVHQTLTSSTWFCPIRGWLYI